MSNYKGWDIKTSYGTMPNSFIFCQGLSQVPNQRMDLDPRRTAKGILIRNVLENSSTTITFKTIPMGLTKKIEFQKYFPSRDNLSVTYWNEEKNKYVTANFYIPDITWKRYGKLNGEPYYLSTEIELIGYGEKT